MKKNKLENEQLIEILRSFLQEGQTHTQEQMCREMQSAGYDVNQSKISRMLKKINAVKTVNVQGQTVYALPREPAPPTVYASLKSLIINVVANESLVIIYTSPGCASIVARILDYQQAHSQILGTIAGDDTIFVAPKSTSNIQLMLAEIKNLFQEHLHTNTI